MEHRTIIARLGGIRSLARKLGHQHHTTVQGWNDRNSIPLERWSEIITAADSEGVAVSVSDLMPVDLRPDQAA